MTPPQLTGDTPILDTFEPSVPFVLGLFGLNIQLASSCALVDEKTGEKRELLPQVMTHLDSFVGKRPAVHPPLRFQHRLDDVAGFVANRDLHGIVFCLDVKARVL